MSEQRMATTLDAGPFAIRKTIGPLMMCACLAACGGGGGGSSTSSPSAPADAGGDASVAMRNITSLQLSKEMSPAWNLGNSLEAINTSTGVPVLLGEYAAMLRSEHDPAGTYRTYWDKVITKSAVQHGLVPVYWDNGYSSNHQMGLFDRATGAQAFPDVITAIVGAAQ